MEVPGRGDSTCPPGPLLPGVDEELPIDGVADVTLERPDGLPLGLALGHLLLEVDRTAGACWQLAIR